MLKISLPGSRIFPHGKKETMDFKENQAVIITGLYNLTHDGAGKIVKQFQSGADKGNYLIELDCGFIVVTPERIIDSAEYWKEKNGRK